MSERNKEQSGSQFWLTWDEKLFVGSVALFGIGAVDGLAEWQLKIADLADNPKAVIAMAAGTILFSVGLMLAPEPAYRPSSQWRSNNSYLLQNRGHERRQEECRAANAATMPIPELEAPAPTELHQVPPIQTEE